MFKHAGRFRDYDISKKEWVLRNDTVLYGRWQDLRMTVEYDLEQERQFDYTALNNDQMIEHLAKFVAGLWQIHPFGEGNMFKHAGRFRDYDISKKEWVLRNDTVLYGRWQDLPVAG